MNELKVGDRVRRVGVDGTIVHVDTARLNGRCFSVRWSNTDAAYPLWYTQNELRRIDPPRFCVGDSVIVTNQNSFHYGKHGVITGRTTGEPFLVRIVENGDVVMFAPSELKLAPIADPPKRVEVVCETRTVVKKVMLDVDDARTVARALLNDNETKLAAAILDAIEQAEGK